MNWEIILAAAGGIVLIGNALGMLLKLRNPVISGAKAIKLLKDNSLSIKRLEILNLIQHSPTNTRLICLEYDKYINMGGNSYVVQIFADWKKEYCSGGGEFDA